MDYPTILSSLAAETRASYSFVRERHIQAVWHDQIHLFPLYSPDGERITVISPGIWNTGPGPDFTKAHLRIGEQELRGDVEIHLNEVDWYHHAHHLDSRYSRVVLHVCLWIPKTPKDIQCLDGPPISCLYLEPYLKVPLERLLNLIDLDAYPYQQFTGSGHCAEQLFHGASEPQIRTLFHAAAAWRLQQKAQLLKENAPCSNLKSFLGISRALGYRENATAFSKLARELYPLRHLDKPTLHAIALGFSGFFSTAYCRRWQTIPAFQSALRIWVQEQHRMRLRCTLEVLQIRPNNHPLRRLAYLVALVQDPAIENMDEQTWRVWEVNKHTPRSLKKLFLELLPQYSDPFWDHHYTFNAPSKQRIRLAGQDLALQVLLNTFLPILFDRIIQEEHWEDLEAFDCFYHSLTAPSSGKSRYLAHRFFGDSSKKHLLRSASISQGALQIHQDFCTNYEASCEGCPFVNQVLENGW